jgi:hypothetical protein
MANLTKLQEALQGKDFLALTEKQMANVSLPAPRKDDPSTWVDFDPF